MPCSPLNDDDGKFFGIACTRGRRSWPKCPSCGATGAKLLCDGCDRPLCAACSVAPTSKLDYCPSCAKPAFEHWKEKCFGLRIYELEGRAVGRVKFRAWVRDHVVLFHELVGPRTSASLAEEP